jgi:SpoVK/Ycf46/Vps4 family AAA+-type ATPase
MRRKKESEQMDIHKHEQLLSLLAEQYRDQQVEVHFTHWDGDGEDEEVTQFQGRLIEMELQDNEFGEKDLQLVFHLDGDQVVEVLMEIPQEEEDLAAWMDGRLHIYGTDSEIVLGK